MSLEAIYNRDVDMQPHQLGILAWPDDKLHIQCVDVVEFDTDENQYLQQLILDMAYTLRLEKGLGLAAPQVGIAANMFIMIVNETDHAPVVFINPEILEQSEDLFEWEEGCLSVPGYFEKRKRPNWVIIRFQDPMGQTSEVELRGLWAFACLHEMDHLQGKVFVDDLSFFKKRRVKSKVQKTLKNQNRSG